MNPEELGATHSVSLNSQGGWRSGDSPEIYINLLGLLDIQEEVVISAPHGQFADLLPVVGLIVVGDKTNHCCVVRKLHNVVATEGRSAVVSQQREEQRAEHTALAGPMLRTVVLDVFLPTRTA